MKSSAILDRDRAGQSFARARDSQNLRETGKAHKVRG
jgi:hypothetical protein